MIDLQYHLHTIFQKVTKLIIMGYLFYAFVIMPGIAGKLHSLVNNFLSVA